VKIRVLALYVGNSTQRKWLKLVPKDLSKKYIQYDVENRWNSTSHKIQDSFLFQSEITQHTNLYDLTEFILNAND
jgi:hypothetical protein